MKRIVLLFVIMLLFMTMFTSCQKVSAGYVGIKVYLLGGNKGIDKEVLGVGQYWIGVNEELHLYPTFIQQYTFTQSEKDGDSPGDEAFYFQNKEGVKCNFDLSIQACANPEMVTILFQKYRTDLKDIMHINLRNYIRDRVQLYASDMTIEELYSPKKVEMIRKIEADLTKEVAQWGITIQGISLLSDVRFPKEVEDSIVAKIKAIQETLQRENEVQKSKADAEIKIITARAEAEAIRVKQLSITALLVQYDAVQKWNGILPLYMGGNATPFINIPGIK